MSFLYNVRELTKSKILGSVKFFNTQIYNKYRTVHCVLVL